MLTGAIGTVGTPPSAGLQNRFRQALQGAGDFLSRNPFSLHGPAVTVPLLGPFGLLAHCGAGRGTCEPAVSNKAMCLKTPKCGQSEPLGSVLHALQPIPTFSPL